MDTPGIWSVENGTIIGRSPGLKYNDFLRTKGITAAERERTIANRTLSLAGNFETSDDVLSGLQSIELYGWPENYYEALAERYRAMTAAELDEAARRVLDPSKLVWVVVGDAAKIRPQLDKLGMPIEVMKVQ